MRLRWFFLLTFQFLLFFSFARAGGIKGKIVDSKGEPVPYATIYVKELGTGTAANIDGYYTYRLAAGTYNVTFQSIGYQTVVRRIKVDNWFVETDIVLAEQTYELKQIEVRSDGRDPAYTIMRKAIAKAKYHTNQLNSYQAEVYMKGSGRLIDSPFFLRKKLKEEGIDSSFAFTSESVSKVTYRRPSTYEEKVISIFTNGDNNNNTNPNAYINASFYEPEIAEAISPLNPRAFAYYKFEYQGFFLDRGYEIDQIKVTPRSRGDNVFEGTLNLVDGLWAIHSLELNTFKLGIEVQAKQVYAPIAEKAWLPINHQYKILGKFFGFSFEANYLASVSDYHIEMNPDLEYEVEIIDEAVEKELAKQIETEKNTKSNKKAEIERRLSEGKEITRKELKKMLKEYEKEERKNQDEPEVVEITDYTVDSMATRRDSLYWEQIRPIPLTQLEIRGYEVLDSMAQVEEEKARKDSLGIRKNKKGTGFGWADLLLGGSYGKTKGKRYYVKPAVNTIQYNTVEGYKFEYGLGYRRQFENRNSWYLEGGVRYGFSRKKLNYLFETGLDLYKDTGRKKIEGTSPPKSRPERKTQWQLSGGKYIFQYNPDNPIHPLVNTLVTLFAERNYMKLYEKNFVKLDLNQKLDREWSLNLFAEWSDRNTLSNNTSHVYFDRGDRSFTPNIPFNLETSADFVPHQALIFSLGLHGRPWQKYRIRNGRKIALTHSSPKLEFNARQGYYPATGLRESTSFTHLEFGFRHHFNVGYRGEMDLQFNVGGFANGENMEFPDYKHFLGNQTILSTTDPMSSFRMLNFYAYSTNNFYANVHAHYQFRKFLATQIMEIQLLGIKENVFLNYLQTDFSDNYFELGYGLDYIARIFRFELVYSFQEFKKQDFGIRIGIATNLDNLFN